MIRETLCVAQSAIARGVGIGARKQEHIERLGHLIDLCDMLRPLGSNGKHGSLHTPFCGCEDK